MKWISLLLMATQLTSVSYASVEDNLAVQAELTNSGVKIVGLLDSTKTELISAVEKVGGSQVLQSDRTRWKMAYRARAVILTRARGGTSTHPVVIIEFSKGRLQLSPEASQDIADAAYSYRSISRPGETVPANFDMGIKCLTYGGQGLPAIEWCGFMTAPGMIK